ncbi:MAG: hypothetical protein HFI75_03090 [Lachnospiraceae bacterium]|nr:hypothetical protein [Lachnospiraceae bacterium]
MYSYHLAQWLLFFYFYSFCGWVWESCFVSVKERHWINRGFMHGPHLPIYGTGAVVILFLTLPVRGNYVLIYILGMTGATILEYVTGVAMERLFHMRYWDYSEKPLNFQGHICLFSSLGWGFFSVLLVEWVHKPVESLIFSIPNTLVDVGAFVITAVFVADLTQSFNEAMDLREILAKMTENKERLRELEKRLERRMDVVAAVLDDDWHQLQEKTTARLHALEERMKEQKALRASGKDRQYLRSVRILKRNPKTSSREFASALKEIQNSVRNRKGK